MLARPGCKMSLSQGTSSQISVIKYDDQRLDLAEIASVLLHGRFGSKILLPYKKGHHSRCHHLHDHLLAGKKHVADELASPQGHRSVSHVCGVSNEEKNSGSG